MPGTFDQVGMTVGAGGRGCTDMYQPSKGGRLIAPGVGVQRGSPRLSKLFRLVRLVRLSSPSSLSLRPVSKTCHHAKPLEEKLEAEIFLGSNPSGFWSLEESARSHMLFAAPN